MKRKLGKNDRIFITIVAIFLAIMGILVLYPIVYVVSASFSSPEAVISGDVVLFPVDLSMAGYKAVFRNNKVLIGFRNSLFYTVVGSLINMVMTLLVAYPLSRKDMPGCNGIMMLFTFTMIFSGGMIPNYLLIKQLGMINTVWSLLLPGAIAVYNMIITRTFIINSIPHELLEASRIDGCDDIGYLNRMVLPLSKSILAVITLYYAVAHWNAYFNAFMYLSDQNLYPLQIFLRDILISSKVTSDLTMDDMGQAAVFGIEYVLKYSLIVVATVPVLVMYPFVQKYFVKGVMIGAVKG